MLAAVTMWGRLQSQRYDEDRTFHSYKNGGLSKLSLSDYNFSQIYLQSQNLFMQPADIYVDC